MRWAGQAGHPAARPVFRRADELDQVRPRRPHRRGGLSGDHARPSRPWAERQAARSRKIIRTGSSLATCASWSRISAWRISTSAGFRSARGQRSKRWARACGRVARCSAARGSKGLRNWKRRKEFFRRGHRHVRRVQRGDPHWLSIQFMKSQKVDRVAAATTARKLRGRVHGLAPGLHHADAGRVRQRG